MAVQEWLHFQRHFIQRSLIPCCRCHNGSSFVLGTWWSELIMRRASMPWCEYQCVMGNCFCMVNYFPTKPPRWSVYFGITITRLCSFNTDRYAPCLTWVLTHWSLNNMTAISNGYLKDNVIVSLFKFHWNLFPMVQLDLSQHRFQRCLFAEQVTYHYLN